MTAGRPADPTPLWTPSPARIASARLTQYMRWLAQHRHLDFATYDALHAWSVSDLEGFWQSIWDYFAVISSAPHHRVLGARAMPGAEWFPGARLNLAEQLFRPDASGADNARPAILSQSELRPLTSLSWDELRHQITGVANSLRAMGVAAGDRVAAYLPNIPEAAVAYYACMSIGAVWSSCSPDMGTASVLDRFRQIAPTLLFTVDGYRYGGKAFDRLGVVESLQAALPTLRHVVLLPYLNLQAALAESVTWDSLLTGPAAFASPIRFEQVAFDHPSTIVYSSGTTGMPKPIVHGHGGILLESLKGHALHLDLGPQDRFHWFSTTGWIMWNSQITALLVGATICIHDGDPGYPDLDTLWRLAQETRLTFLGGGAAYYGMCKKAGLTPAKHFDLSRLRSVGSTGSPLAPDCYDWIYQEVGSDLLLAAISGGTDVAAAFVGAVPILPVYAGEMQARGLGIAVEAFDEAGQSVVDQVGELVVTAPMPSMPVFFWGDDDNRRYLDSYFGMYPGVWRHGDWLRITPRGGAVIYGRSDTTINRHGIRMGTAEIYRVVEALPEVLDSLVVDLEYLGRPSYMPLFIVLADGAALDNVLVQTLRERIRTSLSARHVPDDIFVVDAIPRTLTGKKMELPVRNLMLGMAIDKAASRDAMANPHSLGWYQEFARHRGAGNGGGKDEPVA